MFLVKFLFVYLMLTTVYLLFLNRFDAGRYKLDAMTRLVSGQAVVILHSMGYAAGMDACPLEACNRIVVAGRPIVRVVEGCNAISVMILFTAFIVAFSSSLLRTSSFVMTGIVALHGLNVMRIVLLTIGMIHYPEFGEVLHGVVFPLTIYGLVFFLWFLWINKIKDYAKKST